MEAKQSVLCDDEMAEKRRLNLSLNLSNPRQLEAWRILQAIPAGQRTDAVCRMICESHKRETLLDNIRGIIREELRGVESVHEKEKSEHSQAGVVDENVLGFLLALQQEEGETTDSLF